MPEETGDANTATEETPLSEDSSTSEQETQTQENSQADAQTAPKSEENSTPFHEHPRFKELISEKNELRSKLSDMERILQEKLEGPKKSGFDVALDKLTALNIEPKAAREILDAVKTVSGEQLDARVQPVEQAAVQREIDSWLSDFAKEHEDYKELEPQIYGVFTALPQQTQRLIASDKMGVQLLYDHVKQQNMAEELDKARQTGANAAYKNKQTKASLSPTTGGSKNPPGELTSQSIREMSTKEYQKRRDEILKAMNEGRIK